MDWMDLPDELRLAICMSGALLLQFIIRYSVQFVMKRRIRNQIMKEYYLRYDKAHAEHEALILKLMKKKLK